MNLTRAYVAQSQETREGDDVFGETPNTARKTRALPIADMPSDESVKENEFSAKKNKGLQDCSSDKAQMGIRR